MTTIYCEGSIEETNQIYSLICNPNYRVYSYSRCITNGIRFHTHNCDNYFTLLYSLFICTYSYLNLILFYIQLLKLRRINEVHL